MLKPLYFTLLFMTASGTVAVQAQTTGFGGAGPAPRHKAARLLNENHLTATGETVAHPGASQGAATTGLDRRIEQRNDLVNQSIFSNCN
jgi:hypothetical protein